MSNYNYIQIEEAFYPALDLIKSTSRAGLDIETGGKNDWQKKLGEAARLSGHTGKVALVQVILDNQEPLVFDIICLEAAGVDTKQLILAIADLEYFVVHNLKFELKLIKGHWDITLFNGRCTMVMAQLISNATGSKFGKTKGHGYAALCRDIFSVDIEGKGTIQRQEWITDPSSRTLDNAAWKAQVDYAAEDTVYLLPLYDFMEPLIGNSLPTTPLMPGSAKPLSECGLGMSEVLDLEFATVVAIADMEHNGLPANASVIRKIDEAISQKANEVAVEICKLLNLVTYQEDLFSGEVPHPHSKKVLNNPAKLLSLINSNCGLNLDSTQTALIRRAVELIDAIAEDKDIELANEEEEELIKELELIEKGALVENNKILQLVLTYKTLTKQEGMSLGKYISKATGRIHASYSQLGPATGRLSSSKPNAQNINSRNEVLIKMKLEELQ